MGFCPIHRPSEGSFPMKSQAITVKLPVLPIKRTVLFPGIMMPLTVGRARSIAAVEAATKSEEKTILVVAQRDPLTEEPGLEELDRKSTRLNSSQPPDLVCRLLLEKKKKEDEKMERRKSREEIEDEERECQ